MSRKNVNGIIGLSFGSVVYLPEHVSKKPLVQLIHILGGWLNTNTSA